jgi:hypothetical protein
MQTSSDTPSEDGGGGALRRYGPVVAIVVVVALIAGVVIANAGSEDEKDAVGNAKNVKRPDGAISWSEADEAGTTDDYEWPATCDKETGRVAMPYYFTPECYANVEDNGGATSRGVTGDEIKVVFYSAPENDAVLDYITGPIANDDKPPEIEETTKNYSEMFGALYQTYGRKVVVEVLKASGQSQDEVAARADAKRAVEEMGAFAVWGGPALTTAWADEISALGAICIGCLVGTSDWVEERAPYLYSITMSGKQVNIHASEYVGKKLAGKPAEFAGDEALQDKERVFGHIYIQSSEESDITAAQFKDVLAEQDVELAEVLPYELDPARLAEQATSVISKLKAAGVTTVLLQGDPIAPSNFTQEATAQQYFPEWVIAGGTLVNTTVFGRVYDQEQWQHAFGVSTGAVPTKPEDGAAYRLHDWYFGEEPPAAKTSPVLYPNPSLFYAGLQNAGPNLTPETFRDGLFSADPIDELALTAPSLTWGDHGRWNDYDLGSKADWAGIDDMTEIWYDADATGADETRTEGTGMLRFVDGGKRYLAGEWTDELKVFEEEGSVMMYEEAPESEQVKDYDPPS